MAVLDDARAALDRGEWQLALDLAAPGPDGDASAGLIEVRALAAYGHGDLEAAVTAWERLHAWHLAAGDAVGAARAAAMVAMYLMMDTGLMAPVRGWLRRAETVLQGCPEGPAHALIAMTRTYERFMCGDARGSGEQAALAVTLGARHDVPPAVMIGRVASARLRIAAGEVVEGLALLDEVAVDLMLGSVDPLTAGMMYCELICAVQGLALHDRAREWTEVMERWRHGAAFGGINGRCRVHRAEMLRMSGPCDLAEEEALGACEELRPWMRREFGWPLVELGTIRLRRGDLGGADAAFRDAHEHAWSPQPGLALLMLERGDAAGAAAAIADAIAHPFEVPSKERPPFGDLRLAPLWDAQAEIAAAAGDVEAVRRSAEALEAIAGTYASPALASSAALARGRWRLLTGDLAGAAEDCSVAVAGWAELGAPYETAGARIVLGHVHRRAGRSEAAHREWEAARATYAHFGAARRVESTARLLGPVPSPAARPAQPEAALFVRRGGYRRVGFRERDVVVPDLVGFRHLERLLAEPGRELHVLDLVAVVGRTSPPPAEAGLPVIDDMARAAYRRRLVEVDEDIEDARRNDDLGRLALAERDRDYLMAELASAVGLGGRARAVGGSTERARTSVTRSVRYALRRLAEQHPDLAGHLDRTVRTGSYCSYVPDPVHPLRWRLQDE